MALPEQGSHKWPPEPFDDAYDSFATWSAWYAGDTDALAEIYSHQMAQHPSQLSGGLVGRVARFFWGRPALQASKRIHVPIASSLARTHADLLFSSSVQWSIAETDAKSKKLAEEAQDRLEQLLGDADTNATLLEAAEIQSVLGGVYLRLWWDTEVTDKIMLGAVAADAAIPEWRYGKLHAVTFWTVVNRDNGAFYRHLERHESGKIEHGLYFGDESSLGRAVPLNELPATEWAAELVNEDGAIETGVSGLTAAYVPNVKPNRIWRNTPGLSPMGRSDFDGCEHLFDALDEAESSWMRDLDMGKSRLFVDDSMLSNSGPGKGGAFDPEQAVFTPLEGMASLKDGGMVQAQQFAIRWAEHKATCNNLITQILVAAGYSISDFGNDEMTAAITATEVNAKKDLSNRSRDKKAGYWKAALEPLARTMLELDEIVYSSGPFGLKANPEMKFPVRQDTSDLVLAQSIAAMIGAQAMSTETGVRRYNPNWSNDEVDAEVDRIAEAAKVAEIGLPGEFDSGSGFGGGSGGGGKATVEAHTDLQGSEGSMQVDAVKSVASTPTI